MRLEFRQHAITQTDEGKKLSLKMVRGGPDVRWGMGEVLARSDQRGHTLVCESRVTVVSPLRLSQSENQVLQCFLTCTLSVFDFSFFF